MITITKWWADSRVSNEFSALSRIALAYMGMLPGSGGLECDIGGIGSLIGKNRGSLSPGMIECQMMVRLHKELRTYNIQKVPDLGVDWKKHIPDRDMVLNLPDGFLERGIFEEQDYQDEGLDAFLNDSDGEWDDGINADSEMNY
jgi:hypothetical protein